ncbi:MAG TPA: protein phosphatase CheZ [Azospirillum sp.]|nr:protein phosphatase CheZ [Azospirillum sp.]
MREEDYRQLEAFIGGTPQGRAFLDEHARRARSMGIDEVQTLIGDLRAAWARHEAASNAARHITVLRHELQDMSASIVQARREIAAIRPKDGNDDRIATAANELDAIVMSTERASIEILGAAEHIMAALPDLRALPGAAAACDQIEHEVMDIFTACSFQDLTGQRTTKVVNALRYIEQRILKLMEIWGTEGVAAADLPAGPVDTRPDAHLLNGPSSDGVDQDEVDRLLNDAVPAPLDQNSIDALFG